MRGREVDRVQHGESGQLDPALQEPRDALIGACLRSSRGQPCSESAQSEGQRRAPASVTTVGKTVWYSRFNSGVTFLRPPLPVPVEVPVALV